jgi:uncharacterized protein DUF2835
MNDKSSTHCVRFQLALSADKYMAYYKGAAKNIVTRSIDNKSIKFPANAIRSFLTHDGIYGLFEIYFDENNKLVKIEQVEP